MRVSRAAPLLARAARRSRSSPGPCARRTSGSARGSRIARHAARTTAGRRARPRRRLRRRGRPRTRVAGTRGHRLRRARAAGSSPDVVRARPTRPVSPPSTSLNTGRTRNVLEIPASSAGTRAAARHVGQGRERSVDAHLRARRAHRTPPIPARRRGRLGERSCASCDERDPPNGRAGVDDRDPAPALLGRKHVGREAGRRVHPAPALRDRQAEHRLRLGAPERFEIRPRRRRRGGGRPAGAEQAVERRGRSRRSRRRRTRCCRR